jgi:antitoxin HicB
MIGLSTLQNAKAELYREFYAARIRRAELARRLGVPRTSVDRLFNLRHQSRLDQIDAAFESLGKKIDIAVRDAA